MGFSCSIRVLVVVVLLKSAYLGIHDTRLVQRAVVGLYTGGYCLLVHLRKREGVHPVLHGLKAFIL